MLKLFILFTVVHVHDRRAVYGKDTGKLRKSRQ